MYAKHLQGARFLRRAEMSFLQLLDEGFGWILSQAAAGIEKAPE